MTYPFPEWAEPTIRRPIPEGRRHNPDGDYERAKRQWVANNPTATPEEYTHAMQRIAARLGV